MARFASAAPAPAHLHLVGKRPTSAAVDVEEQEVDEVEFCRELLLDLSSRGKGYGHGIAEILCREIGATAVFFGQLSAPMQARLRRLGFVAMPDLKLAGGEA
ncbi:MAG TPA: hypothetical protein VH253_17050 [Phycisphaerae bacterium]|nr:hypothetical protein [Phycisphaerae bacterium]